MLQYFHPCSSKFIGISIILLKINRFSSALQIPLLYINQQADADAWSVKNKQTKAQTLRPRERELEAKAEVLKYIYVNLSILIKIFNHVLPEENDPGT